MQSTPPHAIRTRSPKRLHRNIQVFTGNRPSLSLLFPKLDAFSAGQLLAIYEHRTAVQGFVWGLNSFDQWGVELGKKLGVKVCMGTPDRAAPVLSLLDHLRRGSMYVWSHT